MLLIKFFSYKRQMLNVDFTHAQSIEDTVNCAVATSDWALSYNGNS